MWRLVAAHIRTRPGRTAGLLLGILVATASFCVLTGASRTGRLEVRGTVAENFRTSYDILVRPRGAATAVERDQGLVRPGALSGIGGGITRSQWRQVLRQPGVDVAAPIASIGYALLDVELPVDLTDRLRGRASSLTRLDVERVSDRGLTRERDAPLFAYATREEMSPEPRALNAVAAPRVADASGSLQPICVTGYDQIAPSGPFDPAIRAGERGSLDCSSTRSGRWGERFAPFAKGRVGGVVRARWPVVIAAVDPGQETRLNGLGRAVVRGRALRAADRPSDSFVPRVPVVVAARPAADEATAITVRAMPASARAALERARTPAATRRALSATPGRVLTSVRYDAGRQYERLLAALDRDDDFAPAVTSYWAVGPTSYDAVADGVLVPRLVRNPDDVWSSQADFGGYATPPLSARDPQYRRLTASIGAASAESGAVFPLLHAVGRFDQEKLTATGDPRVDAALGTAPADGLSGAERASRTALGGRPLLPNGNIGGYQTQAPVVFTNLRSLPAFAGRNFTPNQGRAPISAIRVRVSGVRGIDAASRERVRLAAQAIRSATGLDVDLTVGSSASPRTIALAAGRGGRPELRVTENWVRKGVGLAILSAVDRKSVALFVLILAVCALFVANASAAAVARRRTELAILACTGWSPGRLFAIVLGEVALIGVVAGILGGAVALVVAGWIDVDNSLSRALFALPAGVALSMVAATAPALRAARSHPADALRPPIAATRRAHEPRTVTGLAAVNLLRTRGRTALALISLAVGTASLTLLLAITLAFRGAVVGSVLGDAVAVQVRAVDYAAAAITVGLGALAVADVVYLNLRERAAELAIFRATGWSERHIARLVATEGALLGTTGAALGAVTGLALAWAFTGPPAGGTLLAASLGALGAVALTLAASLVPARLAARRDVAAELVEE